jgi:hypothetical protein
MKCIAQTPKPIDHAPAQSHACVDAFFSDALMRSAMFKAEYEARHAIAIERSTSAGSCAITIAAPGWLPSKNVWKSKKRSFSLKPLGNLRRVEQTHYQRATRFNKLAPSLLTVPGSRA